MADRMLIPLLMIGTAGSRARNRGDFGVTSVATLCIAPVLNDRQPCGDISRGDASDERMIQSVYFSRFIAFLVIAGATLVSQPLQGQAPMVRHADADFAASGYVTPAGMVPPEMYHGAVMPVGYASSSPCDGGYCPTGGCDGPGPMGYTPYGDCDSCDGCRSCDGYNSCGGGCCPPHIGHLFQKLKSCCCCDLLRHCCMFCGGDGCSACQLIGNGYCLAALQSLLPYTEAGLCSQRWYDFSAEAIFLGRSAPFIGTDVITRQGPDQNGGPNGVPVITASDIVNSDLQAGLRLSGAMIFGAGGNLELTYIGGQEWSDSKRATSPPVFDNSVPPVLLSGADLFSFISGLWNRSGKS